MNKTICLSGCCLGLLAVILGAFGAHGLKGLIPDEALAVYHTGVEYQMYHALLLILVGNLNRVEEHRKKWIFIFLLAGIICFSFSLYLIALNTLTDLELTHLGFITPIGGLFLITGWILLAYRIF